jgi:hypothetical protein
LSAVADENKKTLNLKNFPNYFFQSAMGTHDLRVPAYSYRRGLGVEFVGLAISHHCLVNGHLFTKGQWGLDLEPDPATRREFGELEDPRRHLHQREARRVSLSHRSGHFLGPKKAVFFLSRAEMESPSQHESCLSEIFPRLVRIFELRVGVERLTNLEHHPEVRRGTRGWSEERGGTGEPPELVRRCRKGTLHEISFSESPTD